VDEFLGFARWVGPKQATLWFARVLSKELDLSKPADVELWRFLSADFNTIWNRATPTSSAAIAADWEWYSEMVRKGYDAYLIWKKKTGRDSGIDIQGLVRALNAAGDVYQRAHPAVPGGG
jgi:hypothetical protein